MSAQKSGSLSATALAHPNIAFIKYWGNQNDDLRLPASSSLSMNLGDLTTRTAVQFDSSLEQDLLLLNGQAARADQLQRVAHFLDLVRLLAGTQTKAHVVSESNFPSGAGIASSSSAFAALALAASTAAGLSMDEPTLSRLARRGSGSAARSVPGRKVQPPSRWRSPRDYRRTRSHPGAGPRILHSHGAPAVPAPGIRSVPVS